MTWLSANFAGSLTDEQSEQFCDLIFRTGVELGLEPVTLVFDSSETTEPSIEEIVHGLVAAESWDDDDPSKYVGMSE